MGWVWANALDDAGVKEKLAQMYAADMPILVLNATQDRGPRQSMSDITGVTSSASIAIYQNDKDGLQIYSIDAPLDDSADISEALSMVAKSLKQQEDIRVSKVAGERLPPLASQQPAQQALDADASIALPRMIVRDTAIAPDGSGASVTQQMTLLRDSTARRDNFVVLAKSEFNAVPGINGVTQGSTFIPAVYALEQQFHFNSQGTPLLVPALIDRYPTSTTQTKLDFNQTRSTTTSYGFNLSREQSAGLSGKTPDASAKTAFGFNFGKSHVEQSDFNFSIDDYYIAVRDLTRSPLSRSLIWDFKLADRILNDVFYFGGNERRITPMMRTAYAQTLAAWEMPAQYSGDFTLRAQATITNTVITRSRSELRPDVRRQPTSTLNIPGRLPFLTRETTVFLQSKQGNGSCLVDGFSGVFLANCPVPGSSSYLNTYDAQWQLDADKRYVNRQTGRCLQVDVAGGGVVTAPCSLSLNQQWEWRADRLYSLYNASDDNWRLHVVNGRVRARIDPAIYQDLPTNPNHALLIPWSNYPSAPVRGATVPTLASGTQPLIPNDWLRFRGVNSSEIWSVVPLRQNLVR